MPQLKNFVAVDWRSGPDRIFFFFKNTNTYSRFNIGDNEVPAGYPTSVAGRWDTIDQIEELRFGFTTTSIGWGTGTDEDIAWLFYTKDGTPMVCKYDQDTDKVANVSKVASSIWAPILPYFNKIVAGTWWQITGHPKLFKFLLNDGYYLNFDYRKQKLTHEAITYNTMPGLEHYKDRIITAAQNDRTFADSYWYIFLTNNQYLIYNIQQNRLIQGATTITHSNWPGLLRD
ncbi:hypothetical protein J3D54_005917 [Pseudomonas sp. GGS8]|uniref:hypothetical protein n=1 Tax=Pseudomonas sp. GGS8 TaxID=2817892 RepID=UPI00209DBB0D|nr:hypothetical protein [Pseudomonas sp. GGS8]MCP1446785.1 hypothetical protein [Pseudomonas sp. GGS8]